MTDKSVLMWVHEVLGVVLLTKKTKKRVKEKMVLPILCNGDGDVLLEMRIMFVV